MAEKPEDLNLPNAVVFRIIKEAIPPGMIVSKDVRLAISKAASVFVLYCTATANAVAQAANRKTLSGQDVLTAMEEMEFEEFLPVLRAFLQEFKETTANKKQRKTGSPNQKPQSASKSAPVSPKQKQSPRPSPKTSPSKKSPAKKSPVKKSPVKDVRMSLDSEDEFLRPAPVKPKVNRQSSGGASDVTSMEVDDSGDDSDVIILD